MIFGVRRQMDKQTDADIEALEENLGLKKSTSSQKYKKILIKGDMQCYQKSLCQNTKPNNLLSNVQLIKKNKIPALTKTSVTIFGAHKLLFKSQCADIQQFLVKSQCNVHIFLARKSWLL